MLLFLTLVLGFINLTSTNTALTKTFVDVVLQDQFETNQSVTLSGKRTLLLIGDRAGLQQMPRWENAITTNTQEPLHIVRVAYFKGMPFFVPKGWARDEVRKTYPKASVLCDWDGILGDKHGYKDGFAAYLLDASGQVVMRTAGDFSQERVQSFVKGIR
jgi:hypothetical protein